MQIESNLMKWKNSVAFLYPEIVFPVIDYTSWITWRRQVVAFGSGFGVNGPKAILSLIATESWLALIQAKSTTEMDKTSKSKKSLFHFSSGTISGIVGFMNQVGAMGSGTIMGHLLSSSYDYFPISLINASLLLIVLLGSVNTLDLVIERRQEKIVSDSLPTDKHKMKDQ